MHYELIDLDAYVVLSAKSVSSVVNRSLRRSLLYQVNNYAKNRCNKRSCDEQISRGHPKAMFEGPQDEKAVREW
jgi:hypothetical protein